MDDTGVDQNRYGFEPNVFDDQFSHSSTPWRDSTPTRISRTPPDQRGLVTRVSNVVIQMRCTDRALLLFAATLGLIVIVMQAVPIATDQWVLTTEPRPINRTDENDVQQDTTFQYNAGYFQFCRECKVNETGMSAEDLAYFNQPEFKYRCYWNPIITGEDLTEVSIATVAILQRLHMCTVMHAIGTFICVLALGLAVIGHNRRDVKTLHSAILYVAGGLIVCVAVLQFICVVDDEMTPRKKPNASGEQSKYSFEYGYSFFLASLSFLLVQMCAVCQAFLYFRRYPSVQDKIHLVPGLEAKVKRAQLEKEMGLSPSPVKRGSLCGTHSPIHKTKSNSITSHADVMFLMEKV